MRKIESPEKAERKRRRDRAIIGVVLIALLVLSTAGFALNGIGSGNSDDNGLGINEELPYYDGQNWVYALGGQKYFFANRLEEVEDVQLNIQKTLTDYSGKKLYIDSENELANGEIANNLGRFASGVQRACYGGCEEDFPEKTCSDNLIVFKDATENKVYEEENCVFVQGDLKAVDAFLYRILGV